MLRYEKFLGVPYGRKAFQIILRKCTPLSLSVLRGMKEMNELNELKEKKELRVAVRMDTKWYPDSNYSLATIE
jgi:hypothetical protein